MLRDRVGLLFTDSGEVAGMVSLLILPFLFYQVGDALQCTYANALRGLARVKAMVWIAFVAYIVVSLPLGYFLGFRCGLGLTGIWMAFPFGLTTAGLLYYREFVRGSQPGGCIPASETMEMAYTNK